MSADAPIFTSVIGQQVVKHRLQILLAGERMAHAYLFVGPAGSGRFAMAVAMAAILNCRQAADPGAECDCNSCRQIFQLQHPNLILLLPLPRAKTKKEELKRQEIFETIIAQKSRELYSSIESVENKSGQILIDQVRELRSTLSMVQDHPGFRVVVINPADRLNEEAANALLKHLEEPPDNCLILLLCESKRDLLPTIVSRCHTVNLAPLQATEIEKALLERGGIDPGIAAMVARLSSGNMTMAVRLAGEDADMDLEEALNFLRVSVAGRVPEINKVIDLWGKTGSRGYIKDRLNYLALWINGAMMWRVFSESNDRANSTLGNKAEVIERMASRYNTQQLSSALENIEEAKLSIDSNTTIPLALTSLGIRLHRSLG